ncbi:phenylalanine--tRNA ligase subunit beta [Xanthovirga aplysinae]|uniref:phenylalanine--tRNA ligase subunit beta n=1 Tax=Xanthovirga aplysinae TaxID=2529853 RepID=UPI0012BC6DDA|nr:phenylalanine--tRNA ligase subunit beta [Xanthovirga aplysinae]MTI32983.1 phenylalanine--tRNA ligase subunit beta [Xanthovirga aplysinae]
MKISIDWLKQFIDIDQPTQKIADLLTASGLEVEGIETFEVVKGGLKGVVIGEVLSCEKHPGADKLSKTTVDLGNGAIVPIVCGAPNVAKGQKVPVATVGTTLYTSSEESFKIKKSKIRGEVSEGMICAEDELGLGSSHEGIMVLDTELPNGTSLASFFNLNNIEVLEIGLTPNRADATSHLGAARDLQALTQQKVKLPSVDAFMVEKPGTPIEVVVENPEACSRYSGLYIKGVKVQESPKWLKRRLQSIGLSPINNIVDITNFVLHDLGQPLHAFDVAKIKGNKVVVRNAVEGELFITLDEKKRTLTKNDLMICNAEEGMCIAGVFGGIESGVNEGTTDIFLESAYFSADYVRKTSQSHGIQTDSSFRYERGTDPNMTVYALKRAALLIKELAGGTIASDIIDIASKKFENIGIPMTYKNINRLIGIEINREKIREILLGLDIELINETEEGFIASVPAYRVDVVREVDVIEEILRIYGYDNIPITSNLKSSYLADFPELDKENFQADITKLLASNEFNEIITNSLTKPVYAEKTEAFDEGDNVLVLNKLSEDLGVMRQSLLFNGLEVVAHNINRKQSDLKLFEFGRTYFKDKEKYREENRLGIYMTGNQQSESWRAKAQKIDFFDISGVINKILKKFNIQKYDTELVNNSIFEYGLQINVNKKTVVAFGKVNQALNQLTEVKQEVFYADIDWDFLIKTGKEGVLYEEVSKFPEVSRDLSLVIDKKVSFEKIKRIATGNAFQLIQRVNVFDIYEGENIGADKKAYSINFILQDKSKTLTDKIIDKTMTRLITAFEKELGAIIRK